MPASLTDQALIGLAIVMFGAGSVMLGFLRFRTAAFSDICLAGVGRISLVTWALISLSLMAIGYHIFVHTVGLSQFRAPLWIAMTVSGVVVAGSLMTDVIENRALDGKDDADPDG